MKTVPYLMYITTQKTFVLMKTSWRLLEDVFRLRLQKASSSRRIYSPYSYVFRRCLQDVLIKTNILVLVICLQDVFKASSRRSQNVFKTSSRHLQDVFKTFSRHLQDVFKTFWERLQDVCKTYHQVKLFLLTRFQDVFEIYSKRFWDVFQRLLSIKGFA